MAQVTVSLPDELAQRARNAGLLSDDSIQKLLEVAMRSRDAGARLSTLLAKVDARAKRSRNCRGDCAGAARCASSLTPTF